jgi:hypothetical protein
MEYEHPCQDALDLGLDVEPVVGLLAAANEDVVGEVLLDLPGPDAVASSAPALVAPGRVVGTAARLLFDVLVEVYDQLGFAAVGDEVFRDLVIARVVEPTSLLDVGRVLDDLGREAGSYNTCAAPWTGAPRAGGGTGWPGCASRMRRSAATSAWCSTT